MRNLPCGLAIAVMALAACGGGGKSGTGGRGGGAGGSAGNRWTGTMSATINRNVDVLFMIDDSSAMGLAQANLINNFPTFMTTLRNSSQGLPNIHMAVVSQDMGAGDGTITGCDAAGGKKGIFQYTARGTCTATNLQTGATYIPDVGGVANYSGNAEDVFACIAALGESGCGFEHQFAAILRALGADGSPAPAENQGFLRPDAYLAIVMVTHRDDCSAAPGVQLYDTGQSTNLASELGPPAIFRCNEFGHLCSTGSGAAMHPNRNAPGNDVTAMVTYDKCASNDMEGRLLGVKNTADRIKALKTDPSMVVVASLSAPAEPYTVTWRIPSTADPSCGVASCPWPQIAHSCTANDGTFGDPGVRETQLAEEFGRNSILLPICADNYAPSLQRIGDMINSLLGPKCVPGPVSLDPATGKLDCKVTENDGSGDRTVPSCTDNGDLAPCWQLVQGNCLTGQALDVLPDPTVPASAAATISYDCRLCTPGMPEPQRGCP
jgi:hypothetical protein